MDHPPQTRIMSNGSGWYWEVVTGDSVVARGIAETHAQARADAEKATVRSQPDWMKLGGLVDASPSMRLAPL